MLRKGRLFVLFVTGIAALGIGSYALAGALNPPNIPDKKHFKSNLNGYQEVPSVSSTGYGEFEATLVEPERIHWEFRYAGLEGGTSLFAHVHFAQRGVNGGVMVFICGGGTKPDPCPNVAGALEGDWVPTDIVSSAGATTQGIEPLSWTEFLHALQVGHAYVNIHTSPRWPGGEIRGQINNEQHEFDK